MRLDENSKNAKTEMQDGWKNRNSCDSWAYPFTKYELEELTKIRTGVEDGWLVNNKCSDWYSLFSKYDKIVSELKNIL